MDVKIFLIVLVAVVQLDGVVGGQKAKKKASSKATKAESSAASQAGSTASNQAESSRKSQPERYRLRLREEKPKEDPLVVMLREAVLHVEEAYLRIGYKAMQGHSMDRLIGYCRNNPKDLPNLDVLTCNYIMGLYLYKTHGTMEDIWKMTRVANLTSEEKEAFDEVKFLAENLEELVINMVSGHFESPSEVPWVKIMNGCLKMEDRPVMAFVCNTAFQQKMKYNQKEECEEGKDGEECSSSKDEDDMESLD